jgi:chromosome condensin MukBEF ATPase and DNA-binding subunit MukB
MLDNEKRFAEEMSFFKDTAKVRPDLEKINPKYIKESDAVTLVKNLEEDYNKLQMKLEHEQSVIEKTKNDLQTKRQQIEQLKEELSYISQKQKKEQTPDDPILTIKYELKKLGINDDSGSITKALESLSKKINSESHS